jgi:hypothetical protein
LPPVGRNVAGNAIRPPLLLLLLLLDAMAAEGGGCCCERASWLFEFRAPAR